jgi:pimeloyl-ACP methyl ester carboxylesterase
MQWRINMPITDKLARLALTLQRRRSGLTRKEIVIPGGLHYAYLEGGRGEPLLLLHGFGANKDNFTPVARYLTPHYHVIAPDHIGFGESSHPPDAAFAAPAQAARLRAFMKALGFERFHLGGSSMGGQISLTYSALYPGEVGSLWLLDSGGVWSAPKSERQKIVEAGGRNPLMARTEEEFAQILPFVMNKPPHVPRFMLNALARERIRNFALEERIYNQDVAHQMESHIAGLSIPTLIVWGKADRSHNVAAAEILHGLLPNSEVIVLPDAGHLPMIEQPERCAADYLKFQQALQSPKPIPVVSAA